LRAIGVPCHHALETVVIVDAGKPDEHLLALA
jgi:hypothetical protein